MSWEPDFCPGSPTFDGAAAYEAYWKAKETDMITVRNNDNTADIVLPAVDHVANAQDAAHYLWSSVHESAKTHGGVAFLFTPDERSERGGGWAVLWDRGPTQWADAYVVCEGADAPGFVAEAENGDTVVFRELD